MMAITSLFFLFRVVEFHQKVMRFFWQGLLSDGDKAICRLPGIQLARLQTFKISFFLDYLNLNFWRQIPSAQKVSKTLSLFFFSKLSNSNISRLYWLCTQTNMSIAMMDGIFSYFFFLYTPLEWTGNFFFFSCPIHQNRSMESGPLSLSCFSTGTILLTLGLVKGNWQGMLK